MSKEKVGKFYEKDTATYQYLRALFLYTLTTKDVLPEKLKDHVFRMCEGFEFYNDKISSSELKKIIEKDFFPNLGLPHGGINKKKFESSEEPIFVPCEIQTDILNGVITKSFDITEQGAALREAMFDEYSRAEVDKIKDKLLEQFRKKRLWKKALMELEAEGYISQQEREEELL